MEKRVLPKRRKSKVADTTPAFVNRFLTKVAAGRARPSKSETTQKRRMKLTPLKPAAQRSNRASEMLRKMLSLEMLRKIRTDNLKR